MAVYKIFPEKDAFISSHDPAQNTGRDEVLEISNTNAINLNTSAQGDVPAVKRTLIQFKSSLNLYLANATVAPLDYTLEAYPVSGAWDMGTGRVSDIPKTTDGCSWGWRGASGSNAWTSAGGDYYTNKSGSSQDFLYTSNKDISMDVTNMVKLWNSSSIDNHGFIVKLTGSIELSDSYVETAYFSVDTHTIYPPALEFKWDDSIYSSSLPPVTVAILFYLLQI